MTVQVIADVPNSGSRKRARREARGRHETSNIHYFAQPDVHLLPQVAWGQGVVKWARGDCHPLEGIQLHNPGQALERRACRLGVTRALDQLIEDGKRSPESTVPGIF